MANFKRIPSSVLKNPPASVPASVRTILEQPGTYTLFKDADYHLKVPVGNDSWKGQQARLIGVLGGDSSGARLLVTARDPIIEVISVSERPVGNNLWAYLVMPKSPGQTQLDARTSSGGLYSQSLPVTVLPETVRPAGLAEYVSQQRETTISAILAECARQHCIQSQIAYILATVQHESANTFYSGIRETGNARHPDGSEHRRRGMWYYPYYGRGYVQLTLEANYGTIGHNLGIDLVSDPDLSMQTNIAIYALVYGMMRGCFGPPLTRYVNAHKTDFVNARRSVNGTDQAQLIAGHARTWLARLEAGTVI